METLREQLYEFQDKLHTIVTTLDLDKKRQELRELEAKAAKSDFWNNQEEARQVMRAINNIQDEIATVERLKQEIDDTLSVSSEDDLKSEVEQAVRKIRKDLRKLEINTFLSEKYDKSDAILSIHAGQGGTEAMDWSQMLYRMYSRYAEREGWETETVDMTPGEEAGMKSATIIISGSYAYGKLKREAGTHRLVRQSPFNANDLRQTSFSLVEVLPRLEESDEGDIEVKEEEVEWQFFRAGGHGGQNVNKVSTAVRLTHVPTGIIVTSQSERQQEQNRKIALQLLKAKLWLRRQAEEKERAKSLKGEYRPASWGTQIRSYVLHPYKMIKDLRTGYETSDTEGVLDGDLEAFIEAELNYFNGEKVKTS